MVDIVCELFLDALFLALLVQGGAVFAVAVDYSLLQPCVESDYMI